MRNQHEKIINYIRLNFEKTWQETYEDVELIIKILGGGSVQNFCIENQGRNPFIQYKIQGPKLDFNL